MRNGSDRKIEVPAGTTDDSWTATLRARNSDFDLEEFPMTLEGSTWTGVVSGEVTQDWGTGTVEYEVVAEKDGARLVLASGSYDAQASLLGDVPWEHKVLQAARTALEQMSDNGAVSFSSGSDSFSFESRMELLAYIAALERRLNIARTGVIKRPTTVMQL